MAELHFACDDEHGRCLNRAQHIEAIDGEHTVALYGERPITVRFSARRLHLGRRIYPSDGGRRCFGNLLWDAVTVDLETAKLALRYLLDRGWTVEEATIGGPLDGVVKEFEARNG